MARTLPSPLPPMQNHHTLTAWASKPSATTTRTTIYVVKLRSRKHPSPANSSTELFKLVLPPPEPIEIGMRLLLFLVCPPFQTEIRNYTDLDTALVIPLDFEGVVAGERARTTGTVDFVIKNEDTSALIKRAFLSVRSDSEPAQPPNIAYRVAERLGRAGTHYLPTQTSGPTFPQRLWQELGTKYGSGRTARLEKAAPRQRTTVGPAPKWPAQWPITLPQRALSGEHARDESSLEAPGERTPRRTSQGFGREGNEERRQLTPQHRLRPASWAPTSRRS